MQSGLATTVDQIRIMVVDDDDSVRDAVTEILSRKGWLVCSFASAEKAVHELRAAGEKYDLVLTDISMPGMGGMSLLDTVKETAPDLPVVMITGYPSLDLAVESMKLGAVDFIPKPFKSDDLEIVVRKAVGEARAKSSPEGHGGARTVAKLPEMARKRLEDKIKELSILNTISETLDDVTSKDDIFKKTMDIAHIITDAGKVFIMVVEEDNQGLVIRDSSGYEGKSVNGKRFSASTDPFRSVIEKRCYSLTPVEDLEVAPLAGENAYGASLLLAPMTINKEVVMILGLAGDSFGEMSTESLTLLLNLTAKASLKLENIALSENIFSSIIGAINSLLNALDARDTYTKDHSHRVTQYALKIASTMDCPQEVTDSISFAGPLHDIGKIGVRDDILLKKGRFTEDEREIMMTHVLRGEEILKPLNLLASEKAVVLYHHERWDGGGYPNGLKGEEIPLVARIFSVADTFDAMTSSRPYRKALSYEVARDEIIRCSGSQFDPAVAEAFLGSGIELL